MSKCVYTIDDLSTQSNQFHIKTEERARGQDSGETERVRGSENECRAAADAELVVNLTIRKYTCV